jgi:hypothetical protein
MAAAPAVWRQLSADASYLMDALRREAACAL